MCVGPVGAGLRVAAAVAPEATKQLLIRGAGFKVAETALTDAKGLATLADSTVLGAAAMGKAMSKDTGTWKEQEAQRYKFNEFGRFVRGNSPGNDKEHDPDGSLSTGWRSRWQKEFPNVRDEWNLTKSPQQQIELVGEHLVKDVDMEQNPTYRHKDAYKDMTAANVRQLRHNNR